MKNGNIIMLLALLLIAPGIARAQNTAGSLVITMPTGSEFTQGESITFAGVLMHEGAQNAWGTPAYSFSWISSIDGNVGGGVALTTGNLSVGTHIIVLRASDGYGRTLSAEKTIVIKPRPLKAHIVSKDPEGVYVEDEKVVLAAQPDGGTPPHAYAWTVDKAAAGTDREIIKTFSEGKHRIELTIKDAGGSSASASIGLTVLARTMQTGENLAVTIAEPSNHQRFGRGEAIRFKARVSGGQEPYRFLWADDGDRVLSRDNEFITVELSSGTHNVTRVRLTVTDAQGVSVSSAVSLLLEKGCVPDGMCSGEETYLNCPRDCGGRKDGFCDALSEGSCDPDCARTQDPDCLCDKNAACDAPYEDAQNCPADCPAGVPDALCEPVNNGKCDPDCEEGMDPDCDGGRETNYFILLILVLLTVAAAASLRLMRRR